MTVNASCLIFNVQIRIISKELKIQMRRGRDVVENRAKYLFSLSVMNFTIE